VLNAYIPMVLGEKGKWVASEVPAECPELPKKQAVAS
jgi:hypothetical protein